MTTGVITLVEVRAPGTAKRMRTRRDATKRLDEQNDRLDLVLRELASMAT